MPQELFLQNPLNPKIMNINQTMQDAFNAQINQELYSSNLYLQMAFWFRKEGWKGFASWMAKQSDEEKQHARSEEHTSELQSRQYLVCRLLLEKKKVYQTSHLKSTLNI